MGEKFLNKVYQARTPEATRQVYDEWAESYDAEVREAGYATPRRCAEALMSVMGEGHRPILDFGCGTGLSGEALRAAGFEVIDGVDLSPEMLEQARAKGIYRKLTAIEAGADLSGTEDYAAITAIGVIGAGAAPVTVFDTIMAALQPGGFFVFSYNDHTLADPAYEGKVMEYLDCGAVRLHFREHGPHLPAEDMQSTVYVLEKT